MPGSFAVFDLDCCPVFAIFQVPLEFTTRPLVKIDALKR